MELLVALAAAGLLIVGPAIVWADTRATTGGASSGTTGTTSGGTTTGGTTSGGTTNCPQGGSTTGGTSTGTTTTGTGTSPPSQNNSGVNGPSLAFMLFTIDHLLTGDPVADYVIGKTVFGDLFDLKVAVHVLSSNPTVVAAPSPREVGRGR